MGCSDLLWEVFDGLANDLQPPQNGVLNLSGLQKTLRN